MDLLIYYGYILFLFSIPLTIYCYAKWEAGQYRRKGMKNLSFDYPFVGNVFRVLTFKEHLKDSINRVYKAFPNEKYVGYKQAHSNVIMVRDIALIKQIASTDFDHFTDHQVAVDENVDSLFGRNLMGLKGAKWRQMRTTLSPAFTSSKMKSMFHLIVEIGEQMTDYYTKQLDEPKWRERGLVEVELKDAFTRYTNDVIATTAFGFKVDSLMDRENTFYKTGKEFSSLTGWRFVKFLIFPSFPKLSKALNIQLYPENTKNFFRKIIIDAIKERTKTSTIRQDMIQLLMEAQKGTLKHETVKSDLDTGFATVQETRVDDKITKIDWTDDDMVAQAIFFFAAGFETSGSLLSFMAHELAVNQDVQKKLQKEIDEVQLNSGHLEYNAVMKMKFMDMVVSETLRKWPPVTSTDRKCVKQYILSKPSDESSKECIVNVGESIMIPIHSIHHDPKYYPNPEIFNPERFSDENKSKIVSSSYLPFGIGPRNCIGSRFALMETKIIIFSLLKKFDFVVTSKTEEPAKISPKSFFIMPVNGFWIGLKLR